MLGMKALPGKMIQGQVKREGGRRIEVRVMTNQAIPQDPMLPPLADLLVLQQDIMCFHIHSMLSPTKYHRFHSQANFRPDCHNQLCKLLYLLVGS